MYQERRRLMPQRKFGPPRILTRPLIQVLVGRELAAFERWAEKARLGARKEFNGRVFEKNISGIVLKE